MVIIPYRVPELKMHYTLVLDLVLPEQKVKPSRILVRQLHI